MNYLAHALLAGDDPQKRLGALIADFVRGRLQTLSSRYPQGVLEGIAQHRMIDSYSDSHAAFTASRERISPERRRYAGVIVDIAYDHFLSRYWSHYSDQDRTAFIAETYRLLRQNEMILPERLRHLLPRMIADDWLGSYAEVQAIGRVFDRLSQRLKRNNNLAGSLEELERDYPGFEIDFQQFFPQVLAFSRTC